MTMNANELKSILAQASEMQLLDALAARGIIVSAWSVGDLDFLDELDETADLSDEQLAAVKINFMDGVGPGLKDTLSSRGNEYLGDYWPQVRDKLLDSARGETPDPSLLHAFGYTADDLVRVAGSHHLSLEDDEAETLLARLDLARIAAAALEGNDLDEQTRYADEDALRQLRELDVLPQDEHPTETNRGG